MKHRLLIASFLFVGLTISPLMAQYQRYPNLHAPFGPPAKEQAGSRDDRLPPPPAIPDEEERQQAKEILSEINNSSNANTADGDAQGDRINMEQLHALQRFLEMPPEQLAKIRQTIERVEAMSEEEKAEIRAKIETFRQLQEDKIQKLKKSHRMWSNLQPEDRQLMHRYLMSLPREEADAIRRKAAKSTPEEQEAQFSVLLEEARAAEADGTLPSMSETIRKWRRERRDGDNQRWRKRDDGQRQSEEPLPGPPPPLPEN
ncbi:DUF3106 domain-containing protein [Cerasicoccus maritimus]|uniref:DUF3106 domain-containing protein n=1 Tax=Cerasicoccus maritimus TaxID=490089 RepID=UPI0028529E44|nr:DUF3106 domain-containing protein [Cerasicoccus maritimus]